jgi:uncharacterized repeat protein (TIGR01451 family)
MARLIDALTADEPPYGLVALADEPSRMQPAGATAEYTVTLHSTGTQPDTFAVDVASSPWDASLWDATFTQRLDDTIALRQCESEPFGVRVAVPEGTGRGATGVTTLRVAGASGSEQHVALRTHTPAPVLVVDGDFARNTEEQYLRALEHAGMPYDVWELGLYEARPEPPPPDVLDEYPALVWFTGDDWRMDGSLGVPSQRELARYLDAGGRLYFSSADYLSIRGGTPFEAERIFHEEYLGVRAYTADEGEAHDAALVGATGSVLEGLAPCTLRRVESGEDYSDRLVPDASRAQAALLNAHGQTVATQTSHRWFKSLFAAFDAGAMSSACANDVMARTLDWFSPMHQSELTLKPDGRQTFASGEDVTLHLRLLNDGPRAVDGATVSWSLPDGADLDPRYTPPSWSWDPGQRTLTWTGDIARNQRLTPEPEIVLRLHDDLGHDLTMVSEAVIAAEGFTVTRAVDWRVNAADLRGSTKSVPDADRNVAHGEIASFVIQVRNAGTKDVERFVVTDTLPSGLRLEPDTVFVDSGEPPDLVTVPNGLVWRGRVDVGSAASLSYGARVTTYRGGWLRNQAVLTDETGERIDLTAAVFSRPWLLFPWAGAEVDHDP